MSPELIAILGVGAALGIGLGQLMRSGQARMDKRMDAMDARMIALELRMGSLEPRLARLEGLMEGVSLFRPVPLDAGRD